MRESEDRYERSGGIAAAAGVSSVEVIEEDDSSGAVVEVGPGSVPAEIVTTGTVEAVRLWTDRAATFSRAQVACQVMAGFELIEAKKRLGFVQGGRRKAATECPWKDWGDFVRSGCGISDDTARTWMQMAEALRPRLRKLPGMGALMRDLVSRPLAELTQPQRQLLCESVEKLADGKSQMEFLFELGLAKKPQGAAAKGGDVGSASGAGAKAPATAEAMLLCAREDWGRIASAILASKESFTLLEDPELLRLQDVLENLLAEVKVWNATPKAARTADLVAQIREALS